MNVLPTCWIEVLVSSSAQTPISQYIYYLEGQGAPLIMTTAVLESVGMNIIKLYIKY